MVVGYTSAPTVTIQESPKDTHAEVKSWDAATRALEIINRSGTFNVSEYLKARHLVLSGVPSLTTL